MSTQSSVKDRASDKTKEPEQYNVIMINDDFTTMDFVVGVLTDIFHKDAVTAEALMMRVHNSGKAVVGKYPYDIAVTRVKKALSRAREQGFPFRMTIEEA
ncbi:MAG: ATP-dependent Clp protease adaptor ClpS [Ruminiclostridium sp.]|nr:ATP-dependent Clp protease adaptor ClpS [Ruminiclostridium sp.]